MKRVGSQSGAAILMTMSLALAGAGASAAPIKAPAAASAAIDALSIPIRASSLYLHLQKRTFSAALLKSRQFVAFAPLRRMAVPVSWANRQISSVLSAQSIDA